MDSFITLYDILQIPRNSTINDIKSAFRRLAKVYHPDINKSHEHKDSFLLILNAYRILSDKKKRREYDYHLTFKWSNDKTKIKKQKYNPVKNLKIQSFSLEHILSHINYLIWDIEIFLRNEYKKYFNKLINSTTIKEYILRALVFIDKWILHPVGFIDYFMQSRKLKNISFSDYIKMLDTSSNKTSHQPFYSLNNYFFDIRKRIDKFINTITLKDIYNNIPDADIKLIDCIIEAQNYTIYIMNLIKKGILENENNFEPFSFSKEIFANL